MNIQKTDVDIAEIDHKAHVVRGSVTFFFDLPDEDQSGTAHYQCRAPLDDVSSHRAALKALVQEACRQTSRMPEYRLGTRCLSFVSGALPDGA